MGTVRLAEAADACMGCAKVLDIMASSESADALTVTLTLDKVVYPKVFTLKEPMRLVVDLVPACMGPAHALAVWRHPLLKGQIRSAWHAESKRVRLVLDLLPGVIYEVDQDLYIGQGLEGEGARFVLVLRQVQSR